VAIPTTIRVYGDQLVVGFDDGTKAIAYPTNGTLWRIAGVPSEVVPVGTVAAPADDYPWPNAAINTLSPLRYDYRECVDFVAWRLNRDAGVVAAPWKYDWSNLTPNNGDAIGWKPAWQSNGWPILATPVPGCVAWFSTEVGALGHVAYVQAVNSDGTVLLEQYNWSPQHHAYSTRTCTVGTVDSYLSAPPR
jgi:surface antigen